MAMVGEQDECQIVRDRSDGFKSPEVIDAEIEPCIGSIPTTDLSESDDEDNDDNEQNDDNDDSSLGMNTENFTFFLFCTGTDTTELKIKNPKFQFKTLIRYD